MAADQAGWEQRVRAGFAGLAVREEVKAAALENWRAWWGEGDSGGDGTGRYGAYHPQMRLMMERGRWDLLLDCFYQVLPFGTGGRRGPVGVGPNRYNPETLAASVQGHVLWLRQRYPGEALSVVVAWDVRRYLDASGVYDRAVANPCLGLSSRDFAEIAAGVYAANGVRVRMLPPESDTFVSTPELSFAIRYCKASGGLNISASHNPPDDNGGKFYNALGGQEVPPDDERMATLVAGVARVEQVSFAQARAMGMVEEYGPEIHEAYIAANLRTSLSPGARSARVVFTGLHGTGDTTVAAVLAAAGFSVEIEPTQARHDGSFPEVPFRTPNPEVRASMDRAVALAEATGADLVMACDPDADRIGLCARARAGEAGFRFFTGNEIGALVAEYRLVYGMRGRRPIVLKTEVTSDLIRRVAVRHGARVAGELMVGFKYIGEALRRLEAEGRFAGPGGAPIEGDLADFCVGIEESHGVLVTAELRDKDAAGAALALAEYASLLRGEGRTLVDALEAIWAREGYVHNDLISTVMRGAAGRARIERIQAALRASPPAEIGGHAVTGFFDRADPAGPLGPILSGTDAASRDMLVLQLGPDRRLLLRPSGTEPKNKVYVEVCGAPGQAREEVAAEARALAVAFVRRMLAGVGIDLPAWAVQISDLVAVEQKQHAAEVLLPGLLARLRAGASLEGASLEDLREWAAGEVRLYGKDPLRLVAPGVLAWAAEGPAGVEAGEVAAIRAVFGV